MYKALSNESHIFENISERLKKSLSRAYTRRTRRHNFRKLRGSVYGEIYHINFIRRAQFFSANILLFFENFAFLRADGPRRKVRRVRIPAARRTRNANYLAILPIFVR